MHSSHLAIHELIPGWNITVEHRGYRTESDIAFRDVDPDEYAVLAMEKRLCFNFIGVLTSGNPRQV